MSLNEKKTPVDACLNLSLLDADFDVVLKPGSIRGAMKSAGASSRDLWQVPVDQIHVIEGLNPRVINATYHERVRRYADSMKSEGYYQDQPMAGYAATVDGKQIVYIYSGHRRLAAVKLANSELGPDKQILRIPVTVSQDGLSMDDIDVAIVRGNDSEPLSYYETAIMCKRMVRNGHDLSEISSRLGFSIPTIKNRLTLMSAPYKFRMMVANGIVAATLAIDLLDEHGDKALSVLEAAQEVAAGQGKDKVRKSQTDLATANYTKFIKKSAPKLYEAAAKVRHDPGYESLSSETRELLEDLLVNIDALKTPNTTNGNDVDVNQLALTLS